ncbi:hypothetical protein N7523_002617 [Penicillium sp. IBT 18751x]|nr:hypothetical protein N7523_002617 [Penicillium sp. IBT 18751x]
MRAPPKQGMINLNSTWPLATVEDPIADSGRETQFSVLKKPPNVEYQPEGFAHSGENSALQLGQDDPIWTSRPNSDSPLKVFAEMAAPQKHPSLKQAMGNKTIADTVVTTSPSTEMNIEGTNSETSIAPASQQPIPSSNHYRVSKRRQKYQKDDGPARKHSFSGKPGSNPPSEEKLFELLIRRIRQREEQETATVELQCLMEEQNLRLKDENESLKQQLEANHEKLQKSVAESKDRRAQMDHWKEKLRKFKEAVNDLGKEHEVLRDESNKFKATIESLDKEKSGLLDQRRSAQVDREGRLGD